MTNPYAPPVASVRDIPEPDAMVAHASRLTRLAAALLDGIIVAAMVFLPLLLAALVGGATQAATGDDPSSTLLSFGLVLALIGLAVWCWLTIGYLKANGQSIAKKLLGIKIVRSDGSPVSLGRVIWLRTVLNWLFGIIPLYGLVDVLFIFGESQQCLHDKLADTIVVDA